MKSSHNMLVVKAIQDSLYDESGVMCYTYGNMGEVTKETRIYALPFLPQPLALSTLFEYDSWGRILNITYPDNEIVNYDYDLGGQLFRMYNNSSYTYLDNIIYDRFGAKTSQDYGNGIVTQYTYNDTTRRLSEIATNNGALINYTYDLVGNVTQVTSTCPWLQNQSFTEDFTYDSADQLTVAQESQNNGYQLTVNYGHWGKVNNYDLAQTDFINNTSTGDSRLFTYPSDPNNLQVAQTMFAPEQCNGTADILFSFGINGSLRKRETTQPQQHTEYYLFNSQGNLKAYSDDIMDFAYYGYNAANTRTYKLSLYNTNVWINGQQQPLHLQLQQAMFYPNTYLNFNGNGEYTKHYYNGMERVASRLGDNNTTIAIDNMLENRKLLLEEQFRVDIHKLIYETVPIDLPPFIDVNALQPTGTSNDIYYYHINHLGNTAFVTDQNQNITQGFLYAPFGEITTEYNINFGNNVIPKYSFNAKELDEETGMFYYEARYYAPPTFTSRDAMFEKYFWMTPYAYCANNPVKYVDPSGEDWFENELTGEVFYNSQMGRNDAGKGNMTGEGWKWMGDNNMFGEVNDAFVNDNLDFLYSNGGQFSPYNSITTDGPEYVYEMRFGGNSEAFMSKMGYKQVPTQVVEYEKSNIQRSLTPAGTLSVDIGGTFQFVEKVAYVDKRFDVIERKQIGPALFSNKNGCIESVKRQRLTYGVTYSKYGNFINTIFGGNIDLKKNGPCIPNMNLINEFLKK